MFKVHENGDGSTSIFCNKSGKLICTIRSQQKNMGLGCRPVNVVEPSPKPRSCCYNVDIKSECPTDADEKRESKKSFVSPSLEDCQENFFDDCITQENFARCLNLVSRKKLETESLDQLKSTFPLRHLSRTKASVVSEELHDIKLPDDVPLTSSLGVKILKLNEQRNFYCDSTIEMKIKHYDSFCRFQLNTSSVCSNFPKLRCREKKEYPVSIPQKILKFGSSHTYSFSKRQRIEKMLTLKTGLSTRSRKLLSKCNKRSVVNLKRLTAEEITAWLAKKSRIVGPMTLDCMKGEEPSSLGSDSDATVIEQGSQYCIDIESSSSDSDGDDPSVVFPIGKETVSFKGVLGSTEGNSPLRRRNGEYPKLVKHRVQSYDDCFVKVNNILKEVHKYNGDYYVKGTKIRIPFLPTYLNSLDQKHLGAVYIPEFNSMSNSRYDHAYHRPFSQELPRKQLVSNSQCLNHKSSKTKINVKDPLKINNGVNKSTVPIKINSIQNSEQLKFSASNTTSKTTNIPIIDLTNDSAPYLPITENKTVLKVECNVSNWMFHCYGCGYKKMFMEECAANCAATQHMKDFHCVSDPKLFLKVTHSTSGAVVEAFPGYKRNLIK